jgi:hypothetical protein
LLLAVGVTLAVYLAGHVPRGHPLIPALNFHLSSGHAHTRIETTAATFGSTFTLSGTTVNHRDGTVVVEGSWNGGVWLALASASAVGGSYVVRFPINNHGTLKLRAKYPGGEGGGTVLVP